MLFSRCLLLAACASFLSACSGSVPENNTQKSKVEQYCDCYTRNRSTLDSTDWITNRCLDSVDLKTRKGVDSTEALDEMSLFVGALFDSCNLFVSDMSTLRDHIMFDKDTDQVRTRLSQISIRINSDLVDSLLYQRANLWIKLHEYDSALVDLNRVKPDYKVDQIYYCKIFCFEKLKEFDRAGQLCSEYEKVNPQTGHFLRGLLEYAEANQ